MNLNVTRGGKNKSSFPLIRRRKFAIWLENLEPRVFMTATAFQTAVSTPIVNGVLPVTSSVSGDLNGDGIPDLVVNRNNVDAQVFFGTDTGAFSASNIVITGTGPIALGDFNNDGNLDLATTSGVLPGDGAGNFGTAVGGFTPPANAVNYYAQDINGDGNLDLIATTFTTAVSATGTAENPVIGVSVMLGNGDGTFGAAVNTTIGSAANLTAQDAVVAFGDFNDDGILDIITPFGVMLGSASGSFSNPVPLPFKANGSTETTVPTSPIFTVGNFNGALDSAGLPIEDIAIVGPSSAPGTVEIFLGSGTGTFTDNGSVSIGTDDTITSLAAAPLQTTETTDDLIAGIQDSSANADVAVLSNNGMASFAAPVLYAIPGAATTIFTGDFNSDGNPDLLTIDQSPGSTGTADATAASVLLNSNVTLPTPNLVLLTSTNPVVAGNSVTYGVFVQPPSGVTAGTPTGTVTFYNGTTTLGTATLSGGKGNLTVTATGVGKEDITATYSGDSNYGTATSTMLVQTVLETGAKVPLLVPTLGTITLPAEFIPGDQSNVALTIVNGGGAAAHGKVSIDLYLTQSGLVDSNAIAINAPTLQNRPVNVGSGGTLNFNAHFKVGSYPPGNYFLVAQVVPVLGFTTGQISTTPAISPLTFTAAGMVFGTVGTHKNLKLKVADSGGVVATLSIAGLGMGTVTLTAGGLNLKIVGTTATSQVTIASGGAFMLNNVTVNGVLNSLTGLRTIVAGDILVSGGLRQLTLASVASTSGGATAVTLGAQSPVTLKLGSVGNVTLTSGTRINSLSATSWQAGAIDAPYIATLAIAGAFGADIRVHNGGRLLSARLGAVTGGTWTISGGIGSLRIAGGLSDSSIYAGADTGPDDVLGTGDDNFIAATIGSLYVGGADTSSLVVAGADPVNGASILTGFALFSRGVIQSVTIRGTLSGDSRILATHLPRTASITGAKVVTALDPSFQN